VPNFISKRKFKVKNSKNTTGNRKKLKGFFPLKLRQQTPRMNSTNARGIRKYGELCPNPQ